MGLHCSSWDRAPRAGGDRGSLYPHTPTQPHKHPAMPGSSPCQVLPGSPGMCGACWHPGTVWLGKAPLCPVARCRPSPALPAPAPTGAPHPLGQQGLEGCRVGMRDGGPDQGHLRVSREGSVAVGAGGWVDGWMDRRMDGWRDGRGSEAGAVPVSFSSSSGSRLQTAEQEAGAGPRAPRAPPAPRPLTYQCWLRRSLIQTNCGADVGK